MYCIGALDDLRRQKNMVTGLEGYIDGRLPVDADIDRLVESNFLDQLDFSPQVNTALAKIRQESRPFFLNSYYNAARFF